MHPLHASRKRSAMAESLTGLFMCSLTLCCLHAYYLLLINSATLCMRQLCISLQLCHLFLLLSLTDLWPCCLKDTWSSMPLRFWSVCQIHLQEATGHWQADTQPYWGRSWISWWQFKPCSWYYRTPSAHWCFSHPRFLLCHWAVYDFDIVLENNL